MHGISARTGDEAYLKLIELVILKGKKSSPRGMATREVLDVTLTIEDPTTAVPMNVGRKINIKIGAVEYLQLLGGYSSLTQLDAASNGRFSQFADDGKLLGAYGPRVYPQYEAMIQKLVDDEHTRQAVLMVWRSDELERPSRDVPCTVYLIFHVRDGHLHLTTHMRSNDVWLGVPYDLHSFTRLQMTVAWALKLPVGTYTHCVDSLHIYERDLEKARLLELIDERREQPPAILSTSQLIRKDDRASLYVGRLTAASRVARGISFPHLYPNLDKYNGAFTDVVTWYRANVPIIPDDVKFCEFGCRYEFSGTSTWKRVCESCKQRKFYEWGLRQKNYALKRLGCDVSYEHLVNSQGCRCLICQQKKPLVMDHDHETGKFRGLICDNCNRGLGFIHDDVSTLQRMITYLDGDRSTLFPTDDAQ